MSTHNIGFYGELTKIIFNYHQLLSNYYRRKVLPAQVLIASNNQLLLVRRVVSSSSVLSLDKGSKKDNSDSGRGVPSVESTSVASVSSSYELRLMLSGTWGNFQTPSSSVSPFSLKQT